MFSISKLATLAAIIAVVWYGFRLIGRLDAARKRKTADGAAAGRRDDGPAERAPGAREDVVDLVRDERTGEYVARGRRDDRA